MSVGVTRSGQEFLLLGAGLALAGGAGLGLSEVRLGGLLLIVGVVICLRARRDRAGGLVGSPYFTVRNPRIDSGRGVVELLFAGLLFVTGVLGLSLNGASRPVAAGLELIMMLVAFRLFLATCPPRNP